MSTLHRVRLQPARQKSGLPRQAAVISCHNNSQIPERTLSNLMKVIEARSTEVLQKWQAHFGEMKFYC